MIGHRSRISGIGSYLPSRVVSNNELAALFHKTDQWIVERSGINARHYAADGEGSAQMGACAARKALNDAGWAVDDIEFIIFATLSPDHLFPGSGCYMQKILGAEDVPVMDIRNQCTGFLYGLTVANCMINSGQYNRILIVGAETHSHCLEDLSAPPEIAVLFGDGAAAVALEATEEQGIIASVLHADGRGADLLKLQLFDFRRRPYITPNDLSCGMQFPQMDGPRIFMKAVAEMVRVSQEVLEKAGLTIDKVDLVVPHQANLRINETVRRRMGLSSEKMFNNIQTRGNTTGPSIPLGLDEARNSGQLVRGHLVLCPAFGSGLTSGAVLLRY